MSKISEDDFLRLSNFMRQNYGINLSQKKHLIEGRLLPIVSGLGFSDFTSYVNHVMKKGPEDIELLINKLTTNYTYFMRETEHFDYFKKTILPNITKNKTNKVLTIWSAGCSSGEEPYTLSMLLFDYFGSDIRSWDTRILATDISQNVLQKAVSGVYSLESLKSMPSNWKSNYFTKTDNPNFLTVKKDVKNNVIFKTFNLMDNISFKSKFDVIFCRNVMIYFEQDTKDKLTDRFYDATNKGGYLLIGHSETLNKEKTKYSYVSPAIYHKK